MKSRIFLPLGIILAVLGIGSNHAHEGEEDSSQKLGSVHFETSCNSEAQALFDQGVAGLHSFWFSESRRLFSGALDKDGACAMGHWGLAMISWGNPLASPPSPKALADGLANIQKAVAIGAKTPREQDYINAIGVIYRDVEKTDYRARTLAYEKAMEGIYKHHAEDQEAALFYALALNITALPSDKTYANQLKAVAILEKVAAQQPDHPGVLHYLIHSLDYPPLASRALAAAQRYAQIAPEAPHAQHMPAHTYSMLGEWQESIVSNQAAVAVARAYTAKTKDAFPAHIAASHYSDFMIYAYLQLAQDRAAKALLDESIAYQKAQDLTKAPIYVHTGLASIPARYVLERQAWAEASSLRVYPSSWSYAQAITRFTRALGAARSGNVAQARDEVDKLRALREEAAQSKQDYWEGQIEVFQLAASAWLEHGQGRREEALKLMRSAADLEDASEKHVAMENRLLSMREQLGELLLELKQPAQALKEFEASFLEMPNRFRGTYGAAKAAELAGDRQQAHAYFAKLMTIAKNADTERAEMHEAKLFLAQN